MEGHSNGTRLAQNNDTRFFLCRHCRNHVLDYENCISYAPLLNGIICQNPVDVEVDDIVLRLFEIHQPVVNVSCNGCKIHLGQKFVMVTTPSNHLIQEGRFIFYRKRLLFWNGTGLVYADTHMPVPVDN